MPSNRPIVVPTDFSEGANGALGQAIRLAKLLGQRIELLHVYPIPPYLATGAFPAVAPPPPPTPEILEGVQSQLETLAETIRQAGVECQTATREGDAAERIVDHAAKLDADIIVVGTHGRTGWRRALLGSVAELVLRHAPCPVLVVPIREPA